MPLFPFYRWGNRLSVLVRIYWDSLSGCRPNGSLLAASFYRFKSTTQKEEDFPNVGLKFCWKLVAAAREHSREWGLLELEGPWLFNSSDGEFRKGKRHVPDIWPACQEGGWPCSCSVLSQRRLTESLGDTPRVSWDVSEQRACRGAGSGSFLCTQSFMEHRGHISSTFGALI